MSDGDDDATLGYRRTTGGDGNGVSSPSLAERRAVGAVLRAGASE